MTKMAKFLMVVALVFLLTSVERLIESGRLQPSEDWREDSGPTAPPIAVERETVSVPDITWKNPKTAPKGENWTFDLFTAPTIVREGTAFKATLPWLAKSQSTINFAIVKIEKKIYPLQFSSYFNRPLVDGKKSEDQSLSFMLNDAQTSESLQVRLGQVIERHNVEVLHFAEKGPDGEEQSYPQLKIMDRNINREIILTAEKTYYDELFDIRLRSKIDEKEISLSHREEEFSIGGDRYVLKKIDVEKKMLEFSQKVGKDSCSFSLEIAAENAPRKNKDNFSQQ